VTTDSICEFGIAVIPWEIRICTPDLAEGARLRSVLRAERQLLSVVAWGLHATPYPPKIRRLSHLPFRVFTGSSFNTCFEGERMMESG